MRERGEKVDRENKEGGFRILCQIPCCCFVSKFPHESAGTQRVTNHKASRIQNLPVVDNRQMAHGSGQALEKQLTFKYSHILCNREVLMAGQQGL